MNSPRILVTSLAVLAVLTACSKRPPANEARASAKPTPVMTVCDGSVLLQPDQFKTFGSADAQTMAAVIFDPSCGHCHELMEQAELATFKSDGKLRVLCVPGFRSDVIREVQRLMIVLRRYKAPVHEDIQQRLYAGAIPMDGPSLKKAIIEVLGEDGLAEAEKLHGAFAEQQLALAAQIMNFNEQKLGTRNMPQFITAHQTYIGKRESVEKLLAEVFGSAQATKQGLAFESEEVQFGRTPGGDVTNFSIKLTNNGNTALGVRELKLPKGFTLVGQAPTHVGARDSVPLQVQWQFPNHAGPFKAVIEAVDEASGQSATMAILADIWEAYQVEPSVANLRGGEGTKVRVRLKDAAELVTQPGDFQTTIKPLSSDHTDYEVTITGKTQTSGKALVYLGIKPMAEGGRPGTGPRGVVVPVQVTAAAKGGSES